MVNSGEVVVVDKAIEILPMYLPLELLLDKFKRWDKHPCHVGWLLRTRTIRIELICQYLPKGILFSSHKFQPELLQHPPGYIDRLLLVFDDFFGNFDIAVTSLGGTLALPGCEHRILTDHTLQQFVGWSFAVLCSAHYWLHQIHTSVLLCSA